MTLVGEAADDAGGVFDETIALMCEVSGHRCVWVVTMISHVRDLHTHIMSLLSVLPHFPLLPSSHHLFPSTLLFPTYRSFRVIPWTY